MLKHLKIISARILYFCFKWIHGSDIHLVTRKGIRYELDLAELIDFSIYFAGSFQKHVLDQKYFTIADKPVIFDIGANMGQMSLSYAKLFPGSTVYAFEPTDYAFQKLHKNISLNPDLSKRIIPTKAFISNKSENDADIKAFASWKILPIQTDAALTHPVHSGTLMESTHTPSIRLDDFVIQNNIKTIDFIKIDTDGHELDVLQGALESISRFKPVIIFEVGLYILKEKGMNFEQFFDLFETFNVAFINAENGHKITRNNYVHEIPPKSTLDILVIFN